MIGAIVGDVVGSRFEFNNCRSKEFTLFTEECFTTDDSIMTLAVADAIMRSNGVKDLSKCAVRSMQTIGRSYPHCGYGGRFHSWMFSDDPQPYNSLGNGAAMRVSPVAWFANSLDECIEMSKAVTEVTHNHPEGIKGAEATAVAIWMARHGSTKEEIKKEIESKYYPLDFTIDEIRPTYHFSEKIQNTVPQAIEALLESNGFEDAIRTAISLGGDSDTIAAITGSIAEAYYGVPENIREDAESYLDDRLYVILKRAEHEIYALN